VKEHKKNRKNMPRIHKSNNDKMFFVTLTIERWYYIFDRHHRWEILLEALKFYQRKSNLKIYSWVFMLNHIHLIFRSDDAIKFVNSFKSYTSKQLIENLHETESKVLELFEKDGKYKIWQADNFPEIVVSEKFYLQKAKYIIENPVKKGYVNYPEDWKYSSASKIQLIELTDLFNQENFNF
jgi:putative transposase